MVDDMLFVRWIDTMTYKDDSTDEFSSERAMEVAVSMLIFGMGDEGCVKCAEQCVESLDFSRCWRRRLLSYQAISKRSNSAANPL